MKVGKLVLRIVVVAAVLLLVALLVVWAMIDKLVKAGIEKGGTYALQVDTTVEGTNLSLLRSHLSINGLQVANPPDFKTPYLIKSGTFSLGVDRGTLLSDTIRLTEFTLDGLTVYIDQPLGRKSNVTVIMDNVKRLGREGKPEEKPKEEKKAGKKVMVDVVTVRNIVAYVKVEPLNEIEVRIPELVLPDVTSEGEGVSVPRLVAKILPPILMAVVKQAGGLLPPGTLDNVARDITGAAAALGGNVSRLLDESVKGVEEDLKGFGQGLDKAGRGLSEGVKNLFKK